MSKKQVVEHAYNRKKDRFEITLKRFALTKKWLRTDLLDTLLGTLDKKSVRKKHGRRVKDPIKDTRIQEVGD